MIAPQEITIPFTEEMATLILQHRKILTTRTKRYGHPGDWFRLNTETFLIIGLRHVKLSHPAVDLFPLEGFATSQDFILYWNKFHPEKQYNPENLVWCHLFCHYNMSGHRQVQL